MPRAIWKGNIAFGLVNVPVSLYSAEKRTDLSFNLIDSRDRARIRYERVNEVTGEEVPWNEIVKGYEFEEGNYVLLEEEDFKRADVEATQSIEIEAFVDKKAISPTYYERPYYLVPDKRSEKGYVLLRETLHRTGKVGIAKVVIRTRQYLSALVAEGRALALVLLRFKQELRDPEGFNLPGENLRDYRVTAAELDIAEQLVGALSKEWQPDEYKDDYREALLRWIELKARAGETAIPLTPEELEEPEDVDTAVDMTELLRMSVRQNQDAE